MTQAEFIAQGLGVELIQMDGLDHAILGHIWDGEAVVLVYSRLKCIQHHMADGMTRQDAEEWISFNYPTGVGFPILVDDTHLEDFNLKTKGKNHAEKQDK